MTDRTPFYVHCPKCSHEWVALWLPMNLDKAVRILKTVNLCPACAARGPLVGKCPSPESQT